MWFQKKEKTELDEAIEHRIVQLNEDDSVEEDAKKIEKLKELVEIKEKLEGPKVTINPNTIATVAGSLIGSILIINHERVNVITSKAFGLVQRMFK